MVQLAILVFLALCLPVWIIRGCIEARKETRIPVEQAEVPVVRVFDKASGKILKMDIEDYLVGVVAAEMPASYDKQALRAQAVAARTYTARRLSLFDGSGCKSHPGADICTDFSCCQAYNSLAERQKKWGGNFRAHEQRVAEAVDSTRGELVVYNDEPIQAFFFSTAGGFTEDSENAFSQALPYLRSVKSDETSASRYENTKTMSRSAFVSAVNKAYKSAKLKASTLEKNVAVLSRFDSGRVDRLRLGGATVTGKEFRVLLNLDSTNITFDYTGKNVLIKTKGFGHGVGMSQTGADAMAKKGSTYVEILEYYYSGTSVEKRW